MSVKIKLNKFGFKLKKHSPEIMMVAGVVGVVTSTVMACKATRKLDVILDEARGDIAKIHEIAENPENFELHYESEKEVTADLRQTYLMAGVDICKLYGPSVMVGTISLGLMIGSNVILKKRNIALGAAYATLSETFKKYRKNVVDKFGTEVDKQMRYSIKDQNKIDEKGKETKEKIKTAEIDEYSDYARFFDEASPYWEKDSEYNLWFLKGKQAEANDKLRATGHLFLNEVYESIGIEPTKAGQVVGWIYDPDDPDFNNVVDFGIYDISDSRKRAFVNGYERSILLDFNVDGNIWDLMK